MPPQERDPRAHDNTARMQQAHQMVLKLLRKTRPDFQDEDVEVVATHMGRGDGDWHALVLVNGVEQTIYFVGYNYDSDEMYVDVYQQTGRH
jgi:hypothetical protein